MTDKERSHILAQALRDIAGYSHEANHDAMSGSEASPDWDPYRALATIHLVASEALDKAGQRP